MIANNYRNVQIKVIGVGGSGCNAVDHMIDYGLNGVDFIHANTDTQALLKSRDCKKINLGYKSLQGLGAGGNWEVGEKAAIESTDEIKAALKDTDLLFIVCGLGGGTGTGASPIIAKIAQEMNILVIGAVTKPFTFEGMYRQACATKGIEKIKQNIDSLIVVSNDKLLETSGSVSIRDSFIAADETLKMAVETIVNLIALPAKINLDFADIKRIFAKKKNAFFGYGMASGTKKSLEATKKAISSHLLEASVKGLKNAIVSFSGGEGTTLFDINDSINYIKKETGPDINILFGLRINKELKDNMMVAVIGTDFDETQIVYADPQAIEQLRTAKKTIQDEDDIGKETKPSESHLTKKKSSEFSKTNTNQEELIDDNKEKKGEEDSELPPFMKE